MLASLTMVGMTSRDVHSLLLTWRILRLCMDSAEKLPCIFCEANHLVLLTPLSLDLVAEHIQDSCKVVDKLDTMVTGT